MLPSPGHPHVSVIIPAFNSSPYIGDCVASVLQQRYRRLEIIVIDDGSTDKTARVLKPYRKFIRYFHQPHRGVSAARNLGLAKAKGQLLSFLDADDFMLPHKIEQQVRFFEADTRFDMIHSGWHLVDSRGRYTGTRAPWREAPELNLESWLTWKPVFLGAMLFTKKCLLHIGGFDTAYQQAEDVDLVLRLSAAGYQALWFRQPVVCYRQHAQNSMLQGRPQAEGLSRAVSRFFQRSDIPFNLQRKKYRILLYTFFWVAWHLFKTGDKELASVYIDKALAMSAFPPYGELVFLSVVNCFDRHAEADKHAKATVDDLWAMLGNRLKKTNFHPAQGHDLMAWCRQFWQPCLAGRAPAGLREKETLRNMTARDIVKRTVPAMLASNEVDISAVHRFMEALTQAGIMKDDKSLVAADLYAALFFQALIRQKGFTALMSLIRMLRCGKAPYSGGWRKWRRFCGDVINQLHTRHRWLATRKDC